MALLMRGLKCDGAHDERNEFGDFVVYALFVKLVHQNDDDRKFCQNLRSKRKMRNRAVPDCNSIDQIVV